MLPVALLYSFSDKIFLKHAMYKGIILNAYYLQ